MAKPIIDFHEWLAQAGRPKGYRLRGIKKRKDFVIAVFETKSNALVLCFSFVLSNRRNKAISHGSIVQISLRQPNKDMVIRRGDNGYFMTGLGLGPTFRETVKFQKDKISVPNMLDPTQPIKIKVIFEATNEFFTEFVIR